MEPEGFGMNVQDTGGFNLGLQKIEALLGSRQFGLALELAYEISNRYPEARPAQIKLAEVLEICKEFEKARGLYRHIHEETQASGGSSHITLLVGIANCQIRLGQCDSASKLLEELRALAPEYPAVLTGLAACRRHSGRIEEAERLVSFALSRERADKFALHELAQIQIERKEIDAAIETLERNFRSPDLYGDSIDLWLETLHQANRNRYAQDKLEELMTAHPSAVEFVFGYAVLAHQAGEITLARPAYVRALELSPNNYRILYELGVLERTAGNLELSQELIARALELKPDNPAALRTYYSDMKLAYGDESFKRLNYAAAMLADFSKLEQIHLHYALAKAYDDVGELDTSFRHYGLAGQRKRKLETYSDREAAKMSKIIRQVITRERLGQTGQEGYRSDVPVFVLGMPRSGTSLIEQILSAHPDIFGAGELRS
jgi:Flp pilus assembly protein TadD